MTFDELYPILGDAPNNIQICQETDKNETGYESLYDSENPNDDFDCIYNRIADRNVKKIYSIHDTEDTVMVSCQTRVVLE